MIRTFPFKDIPTFLAFQINSYSPLALLRDFPPAASQWREGVDLDEK
ncbi:hypothetical protein [Reticulibacter mediterranei]|nr:hypothetical protein [Reticulibacter mediterranei]